VTHYSDDVCQLGYDRETFGGTDALGMAAQKHVLDWLEHRCEYKYIIAEGDRLANGKFFDAVREMGVDLTVAVLLVSQKRLDSRRRKRNAALGKEQDERWLKTRATKVQNLRRYCDREIDGRMPLEEQVKLLKLEPVGRVLARLRSRLEMHRCM